MMGLSITMIFLLLLWGVVALGVARLDTPLACAFRPRLILLLGSVLTIGAFFFLRWIELDFIGYFNIDLDFLTLFVSPRVLHFISQKLGMIDFDLRWLSKILHLLHNFTYFNGVTLQLVPTYGVGEHAATMLPPLVGILGAILILPAASYPGTLPVRVLGGILALISAISLIALLLVLPDLDSLGIHGDFRWMLMVTILGARLRSGPWYTMIGLLLLMAGGLIEVFSTAARRSDQPIDDNLSDGGTYGLRI